MTCENLKRVMVCDGMCGVSVHALKIAVAISDLYHVVYGLFLAPMANFIKIGQKTQQLEISSICRFSLVGLVGRKMIVGILNSFYVVFAPLLAPMSNFIQIGQKSQEFEMFTFGWSVW